jgi:hypothetical protein
MTGHINVILVLQSCTDSLRVLPGSSSETLPESSDGTYAVRNRTFKEGVDIIEESFMAIKKEEDIGIKEEENPEEISFPAIKAEPDEVSFVCMCVYVYYQTQLKCVQKCLFFLCHNLCLIETVSLLE